MRVRQFCFSSWCSFLSYSIYRALLLTVFWFYCWMLSMAYCSFYISRLFSQLIDSICCLRLLCYNCMACFYFYDASIFLVHDSIFILAWLRAYSRYYSSLAYSPIWFLHLPNSLITDSSVSDFRNSSCFKPRIVLLSYQLIDWKLLSAYYIFLRRSLFFV